MVKNMHCIVIEFTKVVVQKVRHFAISYDEVITIDYKSWYNVHAYVVDDFQRMRFLLNIKKMIGGSNVNKLT
jgi:hypothetical protein